MNGQGVQRQFLQPETIYISLMLHDFLIACQVLSILNSHHILGLFLSPYIPKLPVKHVCLKNREAERMQAYFRGLNLHHYLLLGNIQRVLSAASFRFEQHCSAQLNLRHYHCSPCRSSLSLRVSVIPVLLFSGSIFFNE